MAWCGVSSLTAAVSKSLKDAKFPIARSTILHMVAGKELEGWDLDYLLTRALTKRRYQNLSGVLRDLEAWAETQR